METNNQDLKKQILKKNNNVFIEFNVSGKNYKVPYYPFTIWLYSRIFNYFNKIKILKGIYGEPVSKPNIKMKKDCPYHTDWLICAGIKVEDFYLNGTYNNWDTVIEDYIKENIDVSLDFSILNLKNSIPNFIDSRNFSNYDSQELIDTLKAIQNKEIIFTSNSTEVAHIVNVATDLNATILKIDSTKIDKIKKSEMIHLVDIENNKIVPILKTGILLNDPEILKMHISPKVKNLAILNQDFNILNGVYISNSNIVMVEEILDYHIPLIFRSASEDISASGIFNSIVSKNKTYKKVLNETIESFSSETAKLWYSLKKIKPIEPAILIQPYIEADYSAVIKLKDSKLSFASYNGSCSHIVNGKTQVQNEVREDVLDTFYKVQERLIQESEKYKTNLEVEFIVKDSIYITQAM